MTFYQMRVRQVPKSLLDADCMNSLNTQHWIVVRYGKTIATFPCRNAIPCLACIALTFSPSNLKKHKHITLHYWLTDGVKFPSCSCQPCATAKEDAPMIGHIIGTHPISRPIPHVGLDPCCEIACHCQKLGLASPFVLMKLQKETLLQRTSGVIR